ncbi:hypothetical protein ASE14_18370 [Agromyces sp. Root81]|uniref:hypothetical protein n=1 Tax=Agromyces sp. Root81 TaxID=1736601 RepID=UPI0006F74354|nr:hypothetical protein [Agromyces sp. Root81]KRC58542.1 hypothetical protein ASE14_18370 [Agromyces sp. Root81]
MDKIHPDEAREIVRQQSFPNTEAEREAVSAVDAAVMDGIRRYEGQIVATAQQFLDSSAIHTEAATEIVDALAEEIRYPLKDGARPTPELAARYEALRRHAEHAIAALESAEAEAEWHQARAADPHAAYSALMTNWPLIRPTLPI